MQTSIIVSARAARAAFVLALLACGLAQAAPLAAMQDLARQEQQPLLDTLRELV